MFLNVFNKIVFLFVLALTFASCNGEKQKPVNANEIPELVMKGDEGVFRGLSLGDNMNAVQNKETIKPIELDSAYLYYEYELPDSIGSYNITYNFDDKGLYEIQALIFVRNSAETETVLNTFKSYFDKYYGTSQTEMGFNIWSVKSDKFGQVKVNLSDESSDFTIDNAPGKLSLWIYKDESST